MDVKISNNYKFIILVTVLLLSMIKCTSSQNVYGGVNKLHVDVFYESRCPDSRNFMVHQLKHVYPKVKNSVIFNYVPFGKSYSYKNGGAIKFSCQHGQRECDVNVFQSCVLDAIGKNQQDVQTSFVICAMDFSKNPTSCARNLGVDLNKVDECVKGNRGTQLQLKAEQDSAGIIKRSGFVPTIVYDNVYNSRDFWASLDDFDSVINNRLRPA